MLLLAFIFLALAPATFAQSLPDTKVKLHFAKVFTQGLIIEDGTVWESSGLYGKSMLTKWDLKTGKVIKQRKFDDKYFAEGLAELNGHLFMITWKEGTAFEINKETLETIRKFKYKGEGWGLTSNGEELIMSNGSEKLQFIDSKTFIPNKIITVKIGKILIKNLNELEWVNGKIWANIYQTDYIVVIDPGSGEIVNKFHLPHLLKGKKPGVLNGIAYDATQNKIWVTGKKWPYLFEL